MATELARKHSEPANAFAFPGLSQPPYSLCKALFVGQNQAIQEATAAYSFIRSHPWHECGQEIYKGKGTHSSHGKP